MTGGGAPRRFARYAILGAPALGLALASTTVAAYLPVFARTLTSSRALIGALVGGEGVVALILPVWIGAFSDRVETRFGRRLPFMMASAPVGALSVCLLPFGRSIFALAIEAFAFYVAFNSYYAPYRALYSDVVPRGESGRAQGVQGVFRAVGTGTALVGGALLLGLWPPLPYFVSAAALLATTVVAVVGLRDEARETQAGVHPGDGSPLARVWLLLRENPPLQRFIAANALWQVTETGLKTFIVLYLTRGLHKTFAFSAGAMAVVGATALVCAPIAGKLADRYGAARMMTILMAIFGVGLWLPTFSTSTVLLLAVLPVVGVGGAMALSLPYSILMQMMPPRGHGAAAGLFDLSGGGGALLGPLITGAAIDGLHSLFRSTDGYAAMWPAIGTACLLSIPLMKGLGPTEPLQVISQIPSDRSNPGAPGPLPIQAGRSLSSRKP